MSDDVKDNFVNKNKKVNLNQKPKKDYVQSKIVSIKSEFDFEATYNSILQEYGLNVPKMDIGFEAGVYYFVFAEEKLAVGFRQIYIKLGGKSSRLNKVQNGRVIFVTDIEFSWTATAKYYTEAVQRSKRERDAKGKIVNNQEEDKSSGVNNNQIYSDNIILPDKEEEPIEEGKPDESIEEEKADTKVDEVLDPNRRGEIEKLSISDDGAFYDEFCFLMVNYEEFNGAGWHQKYDIYGEQILKYSESIRDSKIRYLNYQNLKCTNINEPRHDLFGIFGRAVTKQLRLYKDRKLHERIDKVKYRRDNYFKNQSRDIELIKCVPPTVITPHLYKQEEHKSLQIKVITQKYSTTIDGKLKSFIFDYCNKIGFDFDLKRADSVTFLRPLNFIHGDERFDSNSNGETKHSADYEQVRTVIWDKRAYFAHKTVQEFRISKELLRHLLSPANFHVSDSYDTNYERIKRAARTSASVNISKKNFDLGENVNNNTFLIAMYYVRHYKLANGPLLEALALNF